MFDERGELYLKQALAIRGIKLQFSFQAMFQHFQLLLGITRKILDIATKIIEDEENGKIYAYKNLVKAAVQKDHLIRLKKVILANWENPLKGVCDLLVEAFENVLNIYGQLYEGSDKSEFMKELLEENMETFPWESKAKYPTLLVLFRQLEMTKVLDQYPQIPKGLIRSLKSNHLASIGTSLYR